VTSFGDTGRVCQPTRRQRRNAPCGVPRVRAERRVIEDNTALVTAPGGGEPRPMDDRRWHQRARPGLAPSSADRSLRRT